MRLALLTISAFTTALALVLAGCGGGGGDATSIPSKGSPSTPQAMGDASVQNEQGPTRRRGGEESIEEFGSEAETTDRMEILTAFRGYLRAIAAMDHATACSYLTKTVKRSLEQLAADGSRHMGCAATLAPLLSSAAPAIAREQANGRVTRIRVDSDRAFVLFHAPGARLYQQPMIREDGEWKVTLITPSVLAPDL